MTQFAETASRQDFLLFRQRTVCAILIHEGIDTLRIEEVLDLLTILLLPLGIGTTPLIIEGDIHRYAPGVVAEVVHTVATGLFSLLGFRHSRETGHLHLATVILRHIAVKTGHGMGGLVQILTALLGTLIPIVGSPVASPLGPYFIESGNMIAGIGESLSEAVRGKGDQFGVRVDEIGHGATRRSNRSIPHLTR